MPKPTLLALTSLSSDQMDAIEKHYNIVRLYKENDPERKLGEIKDDVQAVLATMNNPVRDNLIAALPNLEIISLFSVGFDNVDIDFAKNRDIIVTNTPDLVTADTADTALALMLAVSRRVVEADAFVRVGRWENRTKFPLGHSLTNKRVGIVGLGRIGKAIARRCAAFDMHIAYYGRSRKTDVDYTYYDDLGQMAKDCDYLVLSCPGGDATKHIINKDIFAAMGPDKYLVNVARGSVVKEEDLVNALKNKIIAGAGLDVYENEPSVPEALKKLDNVVLLPHIGTATMETRHAMGDLVVENLLAHIQGKPVLSPVI